MRNPLPEIENDKIRGLIAAEENAALVKFRAGDFEADVQKRIGGVSTSKDRFSVLRILPVPAWVAIAGGLLFAGIVFVFLSQKTPRSNLAQTIEAVLGRTDGFLARQYDVLERNQPDSNFVSSPSDNFLTAVLRKASSTQNPVVPSLAPAKTSRVKPLRLEDMYKILFIDKSIEHVLMLLSS